MTESCHHKGQIKNYTQIPSVFINSSIFFLIIQHSWNQHFKYTPNMGISYDSGRGKCVEVELE